MTITENTFALFDEDKALNLRQIEADYIKKYGLDTEKKVIKASLSRLVSSGRLERIGRGIYKLKRGEQ